MITDFKIHNYRSIKDLWLKMQQINVIVGPNGSGKSNLYRAMYLVSATASGQFARTIANEGGMRSALWAAGGTKNDHWSVRLSVRVDDFEYNLTCDRAKKVLRPELPLENAFDEEHIELFEDDPVIRKEEVFRRIRGTKKTLLKRGIDSVSAWNSSGQRVNFTTRVPDNDSVLNCLRDPSAFPDLFRLREEFRSWRFYHDFRTDVESPLRKPQISVMTPLMSHDGLDVVAALATICVGADGPLLDDAVAQAFPGGRLKFQQTRAGLRLYMTISDRMRPFEINEVSDGTLQYLCLVAALMSDTPPPVIALNEPETSIHPRLLEPLARLIVRASERSQLWVTTHSRDLADYILEFSGTIPFELQKVKGATRLVGVGLGGYREEDDDYDDEERQPDSGDESDDD